MWYFEYLDLDSDIKNNFMKYLPPVRPKLVPKLKVFRIYWNLVHSIFQICQSWFWCQKLFLLNIYHLLGPNWSQNEKCLGLIEIWHIWYFEYPDLDFDVKNYFLSNIFQLLGQNWSKNKKMLSIYWNLIKIWKLIKIFGNYVWH